MSAEKTKEALEALETLESIAHLNLHGSVETSQFKCVDIIRAALIAQDVNDELLEALNKIKRVTSHTSQHGSNRKVYDIAQHAIANAEQKGGE